MTSSLGDAHRFTYRAALASLMLVSACHGGQRIGGSTCPTSEDAPFFQEREPEWQTADTARASRGVVLVYLRHGVPNGAPLEDANVSLYRGDAVGAGVGLIESAITDATGLALIDSLRPREYRIDIRRIGYVPVSGRVEVRRGRVHIIDAALARNMCAGPSRSSDRVKHRPPLPRSRLPSTIGENSMPARPQES